jgi:hypothetical protein
MLSKVDIVKIITIVHADSGYRIRPEKIGIWFDALQHLDLEVALTVAKYCRTIKFFGEPKLSDFLNALEKCTKPKELDISADLAFNMILDGIKRFSYHHDDQLLKSLPDVVCQAAKIFGLREIRMSENISICRSQFAKCFESIKIRCEREFSENISLPPGLQKQLDDLRVREISGVKNLLSQTLASMPKVLA